MASLPRFPLPPGSRGSSCLYHCRLGPNQGSGKRNGSGEPTSEHVPNFQQNSNRNPSFPLNHRNHPHRPAQEVLFAILIQFCPRGSIAEVARITFLRETQSPKSSQPLLYENILPRLFLISAASLPNLTNTKKQFENLRKKPPISIRWQGRSKPNYLFGMLENDRNQILDPRKSRLNLSTQFYPLSRHPSQPTSRGAGQRRKERRTTSPFQLEKKPNHDDKNSFMTPRSSFPTVFPFFSPTSMSSPILNLSGRAESNPPHSRYSPNPPHAAGPGPEGKKERQKARHPSFFSISIRHRGNFFCFCFESWSPPYPTPILPTSLLSFSGKPRKENESTKLPFPAPNTQISCMGQHVYLPLPFFFSLSFSLEDVIALSPPPSLGREEKNRESDFTQLFASLLPPLRRSKLLERHQGNLNVMQTPTPLSPL